MMNHLMLDIETMSTQNSAAMLQIAAVEFDILTGETGKEFNVNVNLQSCLDCGLTMEASTVMWWMQQSDEARKSLIKTNPLHLKDALIEFSKFCTKEYEVWGNSARFDCGILQNAYNVCGMEIPWDFRKERCVRTLLSFNPSAKKETPFVGNPHNAIDDCKHQIAYCSAIWAKMNK